MLPPDSVDHLVDYYALQMTFGGGGESTFSSINTLTKHLAPGGEALDRHPPESPLRFPGGGRCGGIANWRVSVAEDDDPGLLAVSEFNRIMFGDHPIGWEMTEEDLTSDRLSSGCCLPGPFPDLLP